MNSELAAIDWLERGWLLLLAFTVAVLREHAAPRRGYANAMLKTQSAAIALPVGCPWSPRHPVTERIEMLTNPLPKTFRRLAGLVSLLALLVGTSAAVYAAQQGPTGVRATPEAVKEAMVLFDGSKTAVAEYLLSHYWQASADNDVAGLSLHGGKAIIAAPSGDRRREAVSSPPGCCRPRARSHRHEPCRRRARAGDSRRCRGDPA